MNNQISGNAFAGAQPKDTILKSIPVMDVRAFTGELEPVINEDKAAGPTLADYDHLRITAEKTYPNNEPIITWGGSGIAAPCNLTAISAQAKAGKTAFCGMLLAGAFNADATFTEIDVTPCEDKAVIVLDTEQAEQDQQYNVRTVLCRAGLATTPPNFLSYNIRQLHIAEYQAATNSICEAANNEFGGIHSIYIDGVADFISDVNSIEQATAIREYFTLLSIRYHCPVILVIHQNPNSTKERGHLGSEIQRKCYGIIQITKDGDTSIAKNTFSRKAGELEPVFFKYSQDAGYHIEVDAPVNDATAATRKKIEDVLKSVMRPLDAYTYTELENKVIAATTCSVSTFKRYLKIWGANKWIEKGQDGSYRMRGQGSTGVK